MGPYMQHCNFGRVALKFLELAFLVSLCLILKNRNKIYTAVKATQKTVKNEYGIALERKEQ